MDLEGNDGGVGKAATGDAHAAGGLDREGAVALDNHREGAVDQGDAEAAQFEGGVDLGGNDYQLVADLLELEVAAVGNEVAKREV